MPQVAARISFDHELKLQELFKTKSAGAEFLLPWALDAFSREMNQLRAEFSVSELKTFIEAYRNYKLQPQQLKLSYLMLRMDEAFAQELNTVHGASKVALERKLPRLNDLQAAALMVWASGYWTSKVWKEVGIDDYAQG